MVNSSSSSPMTLWHGISVGKLDCGVTLINRGYKIESTIFKKAPERRKIFEASARSRAFQSFLG